VSALAIALASGCSAPDQSTELTADGSVWRESFYENFAVHLSPSEANCMASEVGVVTRLVGPLVGQRPDDTPGSVWTAVDRCLVDASKAETARAIVYGGWSADEPALADKWASADEVLAQCVHAAGGWQAIGSHQAFMAACQPTVSGGVGR